MSRSELYATALREYIQRQDRANLTEEINRAIDEIGEDALRVDPALAAHQAKLLPREEW
jgi:metal-responsive CopG/Arc/MetJ family transcriptional regulator